MGSALPGAGLLLCVLALTLSDCRTDSRPVTIFHAGSLAPLVREMGHRFQQHHPGVTIQSEASGSLDVIRKITELRKSCDIVATADSQLIGRFLVPDVVQSYYAFLGNEIVLATARPELFQQRPGPGLTWQEDWFDLLFTQTHTYGISDPDRDPAGYYSHLVWKLTEIHYDRPGLYRRFTLRLDPRWIRPRSSELVALLETGTLDFAFLYKSSALQNNLAYLTLPPQVSLGEVAYAEGYSRAFVRVGGPTPGSTIEIRGAPIQYGLALVSDSNVWAQRFVDFLLSPESEQTYREMGYLTFPIRKISAKEFSNEIDSNLAGASGSVGQRLPAGDPRPDPVFDAQFPPAFPVGDTP